VLFSATRRIANEQLRNAGEQPRGRRGSRRRNGPRVALDVAIDLPSRDSVLDEELFAAGLRHLVESFVASRR
jgi:hypothetical protein